jgi:hypothetical protein
MRAKSTPAHGVPAIAIVLAVLFGAFWAAPALAAEGPGWELNARQYPSSLAPGHHGSFQIEVFNVGAGSSAGPVTVTDTLPPGVKALDAGELESGLYGHTETLNIGHEGWECTGNGNGPPPSVAGASVVKCVNNSELVGGAGNTSPKGKGNAQVIIAVEAEPGTPETTDGSVKNEVTVAGGQAPAAASTTVPVIISKNPVPFGLPSFNVWFSNADGTVDTQAGSHPYSAAFSFAVPTNLNSEGALNNEGIEPRNIEVELPPGLIGDPTAVPQCSHTEFIADNCPRNTQVGIIAITTFSGIAVEFSVFNLVPSEGMPAQLGFKYEQLVVYINTSVRSGRDYGVTAKIPNAPQQEPSHATLILWGTPGEVSHDPWRAGQEAPCTPEEMEKAGIACSHVENPSQRPFLTLPTECGAVPKFTMRLDSWQDGATEYERSIPWRDSTGKETALTGCEQLAFAPTLLATLESSGTDSATGLTVDVKPPLGALQATNGVASSDIEGATVALPVGVAINPGQAAGLQACPESQDAIGTESAPSCPAASKVGTVAIQSPLLEAAAEKELRGNIYILPSNPPEVRLLVAASADGVNVKLVGTVHLNEATAALTTTFTGTPQLPFSDFKLSFAGGARAALVTPAECGTYAATADFASWGSPFIPDFDTGAAFAITVGVGGGPCPSGPLPFSPSLAAGSTNTEAGAFTGFTQLLSRGDGQQRLEKFQFKEPTGMAGMLSQVPLCPEAEANAGTCNEASKIGHAIVASGPGNNPLTLPQPGGPEIPIYLTGPYHGAPFGLSIKTPVVAGPFNLGTIVTRAKIEVDPTTAQITIATDPLPQILDGVPTDLRSIYAVIDRQGFLFNPTNCTPQEFKGTATSAGGAAVAPISSHFGIGACKALKFAPKFSASTSGKTSKANGASLHVKIAYPSEPQGSEADIAKVNLTIPAILPTRLTTIQKACTEAQFNANPAGCPAASVIATAIVHTPVLKSPLTGPAYFVSHGGAAFPDVEMILQGEGVTLIVDGKTQIKKGVTFSHFETVPDAPFSSFEFIAPQGPFSIFTANGNLCASEVKMPTTLTAQNGAVLTQSTPVEVQGCPNGLKILSHSLRNRTLTIKVIVPGAGKLTASGKGLSKSSKSSKGRSTLTLTIKAKKGGRLRTKVKLSFAPTKGHKLAATVAARFKR